MLMMLIMEFEEWRMTTKLAQRAAAAMLRRSMQRQMLMMVVVMLPLALDCSDDCVLLPHMHEMRELVRQGCRGTDQLSTAAELHAKSKASRTSKR